MKYINNITDNLGNFDLPEAVVIAAIFISIGLVLNGLFRN